MVGPGRTVLAGGVKTGSGLMLPAVASTISTVKKVEIKYSYI